MAPTARAIRATRATASRTGSGRPGSTFCDSGVSLPGVTGGSAAFGDYNADGYLDILLAGTNNAGVPMHGRKLVDVPPADWEFVIAGLGVQPQNGLQSRGVGGGWSPPPAGECALRGRHRARHG